MRDSNLRRTLQMDACHTMFSFMVFLCRFSKINVVAWRISYTGTGGINYDSSIQFYDCNTEYYASLRRRLPPPATLAQNATEADREVHNVMCNVRRLANANRRTARTSHACTKYFEKKGRKESRTHIGTPCIHSICFVQVNRCHPSQTPTRTLTRTLGSDQCLDAVACEGSIKY